ncbi:peptide chain release factor N(5)-glutamine methyltransferase [Paenibacillus urinalis]|uniref:Release factor glutamine methyltransferase n=1 Tax=Paenibacillus urinalis TaxID=521520 RepID=A0AAX3MYA5_9BACL|nr:peptide chain release factor N(5)-glutamine methyltransferase [Paenibacillus urinalis]WDH82302.1 peptide chain release factor N(5)-glutamine methyltransferase [Paenibacillus urinalis]WDI02020.1 peptide chain release factor N(5)-glutamine methyltransferase [Paenibacillus urinalis]
MRLPFELPQGSSNREAFLKASSFLEDCGVLEPQNNARLLLEYVLGLEGAAYYMALPDAFPEEQIPAFEEAVNRKGQGEPAQYIIGRQEFYGLPFKVSPAVLIPRPETELLVEAVMLHGDRLWPGGTPLAADIGTGSGAIAVTLAVKRTGWHVEASDISPEALAVAAQNAAANGAAVQFREGDLLAPFAGERVDILVSNPPYIPADDIAGLQREVREHEPRTALDGGPDGLGPYRTMMAQLALLAAPPRLIGFELGQGQAEDVAELLRVAGHWDEIIVVPDLAGIDRHVMGIRNKG